MIVSHEITSRQLQDDSVGNIARATGENVKFSRKIVIRNKKGSLQ